GGGGGGGEGGGRVGGAGGAEAQAEDQRLRRQQPPGRQGAAPGAAHAGVGVPLQPLVQGAGAAGHQGGAEDGVEQGTDRHERRAGQQHPGGDGEEHQHGHPRLGQRQVVGEAAEGQRRRLGGQRRRERRGRRRLGAQGCGLHAASSTPKMPVSPAPRRSGAADRAAGAGTGRYSSSVRATVAANSSVPTTWCPERTRSSPQPAGTSSGSVMRPKRRSHASTPSTGCTASSAASNATTRRSVRSPAAASHSPLSSQTAVPTTANARRMCSRWATLSYMCRTTAPKTICV